MNVDRHVDQGGFFVAKRRIQFCLDQLERYGFKRGYTWSTEIAHALTLEEIVGALVAAEQVLEVREEACVD